MIPISNNYEKSNSNEKYCSCITRVQNWKRRSTKKIVLHAYIDCVFIIHWHFRSPAVRIELYPWTGQPPFPVMSEHRILHSRAGNTFLVCGSTPFVVRNTSGGLKIVFAGQLHV